MDIRKLALYLSGKLPPHYGESNLYAFGNALKTISPEKYSREEMVYINELAKGNDEEVYFMVLDELWKQAMQDQDLKTRILELCVTLGVHEEVYRDLKTDVCCSGKGKELLELLQTIPVGKEGAKQFEDFGKEFVEYVFKDSFYDFQYREQTRSEDMLNIKDGILSNTHIKTDCSISSFWGDIVRRKFDTDTIVIEYKNYTDPLNQDPVFKTTKYLNKVGYGRFGIMLSREGAGASGETMQVELLKGSGDSKPLCLLLLDDIDMQHLLEIKEKGENPEIYLMKKYQELIQKV